MAAAASPTDQQAGSADAPLEGATVKFVITSPDNKDSAPAPAHLLRDAAGELSPVFDTGLDQPTPRLRTGDADVPTSWKPVYRIVLTGGPCAGKTTSLSRLRAFLENRGFFTCVQPEASTLLRTGGVDYTPQDDTAFQTAITTAQALLEGVWYNYAERIAKATKKPAVILLDRALMDGSVYVPQEKFLQCLVAAGIEPKVSAVLKRYDAIFHLVTAADGAVEFYQQSAVRFEDVKLAVDLDKRLRRAYHEHAHHYLFRNHGNFEDKVAEVTHRMCDLLNLPDTTSAPRKFLLNALPHPEQFAATAAAAAEADAQQQQLSDVVVVHVTKTYIKNDPAAPGGFKDGQYTFVSKRQQAHHKPSYAIKMVLPSRGQRIERRREITKRQYLHFLTFPDVTRHVVRQQRICFTYQRAFFQIDQYVEPSPGLMVVNVFAVPDEFPETMPSFLDVGAEVTDDAAYSAYMVSFRSSPSLERPDVAAELVKQIGDAAKRADPVHFATAEDPEADEEEDMPFLPGTPSPAAPKRSWSKQALDEMA